jgi:hypothetical protein
MIVAPRSETEHAVAALWADVGVRPASIDDEFLTVGGDPPRTARLLAYVFERWHIHISVDDFLARSSIAGLSATIERRRAEARTFESDILKGALEGLDAFDGPTTD